jgi:glycosyltransferase involved in cell wall biosynthesis
MAKIIICVATPLYAPDIGGPATHVALLEQGLSRDRFELRIVKFGEVRHLPKIIRHLVYMRRVLRAAKDANFIYVLDPVSVGLPATIAARLLHKPFILRVGGDYAWEQGVQRFGIHETLDEFVTHSQPSFAVSVLQTLQSYVARRAHMVVAPSEYLAHIISTWGVPASRITVVYSQPELAGNAISRSDARKKLNIREDEEIIISAGRLVPWKGFEGVVDAVGRIRNNRPVRLFIAGDGPARSALESHIASTRSEHFVTLLGQLGQEELMAWIAAADMLALNTKYEGLSHLLLEAFILRTPVITTPVGGNTELVEDGKTGLFVAHNDTDALAGAILRLLLDRPFAVGIADGAFQSLERFSKDAAIQKLDEIYTTV